MSCEKKFEDRNREACKNRLEFSILIKLSLSATIYLIVWDTVYEVHVCLVSYATIDVGACGHMRHVPPTFQRLCQSAPFRVTWLPSLKTLKMQILVEKYAFPAISNDLNFKIARGTCPRRPLFGFHCFTPQTKCSISLPETLPRCPSIYVPPLL